MTILGIDEVGRGPWAGPLVVGAVILPEEKPDWVEKLKDSKKLTAKKREELSKLIWREATAGLGWVSTAEIDELGLGEALKLASRRALKEMAGQHAKFSQIIIDGNQNFLKGTALEKRVSTLVKADGAIKEVSAASIIAKVARDRYMCELAEKYPQYGFEKHKGYGTAFHRVALEKFGVSPVHRKSFRPVREILGLGDFEKVEPGPVKNAVKNAVKNVDLNTAKNTTKIGKRGETAVAEFLERNGHRILLRNFKTPRYEIDLVSVRDDKIYFTEVKYRKNERYGGGMAAITAAKKRQMRFAAEAFLCGQPKLQNLKPLLAVADVTGEDYEVCEFIELME